jgi:hypothetical protein
VICAIFAKLVTETGQLGSDILANLKRLPADTGAGGVTGENQRVDKLVATVFGAVLFLVREERRSHQYHPGHSTFDHTPLSGGDVTRSVSLQS